MYIGHKRKNDRLSNIININEEMAEIEYGYSSSIIQTSERYKTNRMTWSDEIGETLIERKIEITNTNNRIKEITCNKTIMDFAKEYIEVTQQDIKWIATINHVRLYKKMILPCELVGMNGGKRTKEMKEWNTRSCIQWKINFPTIPKPSKKSIQIWKDFTEWLRTKHIMTIYDFSNKATFKYCIRLDSNMIKEVDGETTRYFEKKTNQRGQRIYQEIQH